MPHIVEISPAAGRDLKRLLPTARDPIETAIYALADNPRPTNATKLVGAEDQYRLRVGQFRVIYRILDRLRVVVVGRVVRRSETTYRNR